MDNRLIAALILTVVLSACQANVTREDPQLVVSPNRTDALLADAADRATKALESLATIEKAKNPGMGDASMPNAPTELRRSVTLTWNGPIEPVAKMLADRASYTFNTAGNAPPTQIMINIDVRAEPVINVLRSIGLQMGERGNLRVDPNQRVIEISYAPTGIPGSADMYNVKKEDVIGETPLPESKPK